jgi:hypothetical protein
MLRTCWGKCKRTPKVFRKIIDKLPNGIAQPVSTDPITAGRVKAATISGCCTSTAMASSETV